MSDSAGIDLSRFNGVRVDDVKIQEGRCCGCGRGVKFAVPPSSRTHEKHECRMCGYVTEHEVRASVLDGIGDGITFDDHVGEGKERNHYKRIGKVSFMVKTSPPSEKIKGGLRITDKRRFRHEVGK